MPRPRLKPTEEQRRLVKGMAAMFISHERIARLIGIKSVKTLRKFFPEELHRAETETRFKMEHAQYESALKGNATAQADWFRRHADRKSTERPVAPAPFIVYRDGGVGKGAEVKKDAGVKKDAQLEEDPQTEEDTDVGKGPEGENDIDLEKDTEVRL